MIRQYYTEITAVHNTGHNFFFVTLQDIAQEKGISAMPTFQFYKAGVMVSNNSMEEYEQYVKDWQC